MTMETLPVRNLYLHQHQRLPQPLRSDEIPLSVEVVIINHAELNDYLPGDVSTTPFTQASLCGESCRYF